MSEKRIEKAASRATDLDAIPATVEIALRVIRAVEGRRFLRQPQEPVPEYLTAAVEKSWRVVDLHLASQLARPGLTDEERVG